MDLPEERNTSLFAETRTTWLPRSRRGDRGMSPRVRMCGRGCGCVVSIGAAALVLVQAGCSVDGATGAMPTSAPGRASAAAPKAYIDESAGEISLPVDQFFLTEAELDDVHSALGVAMIDCLEDVGIDSVEERRRVIPHNDMSRAYGVWRMADAERFGYVIPESAEKEEALVRNSSAGQEMSEAELAARHECATTPELVRFQNPYPEGVWLSELHAAVAAGRSSQEWNEVIADWERCLSGAGLDLDLDEMVPAGVDFEAVDRREVTENDVRIAVADVKCKNEVNLVQRLANLDAAAQAPVIAQYRDEMLAARVELDAILADARRILTEAGL